MDTQSKASAAIAAHDPQKLMDLIAMFFRDCGKSIPQKVYPGTKRRNGSASVLCKTPGGRKTVHFPAGYFAAATHDNPGNFYNETRP